MQVYVVYQQTGIAGVYDSLLAVKQDFYLLTDDWDTILAYSEEDFTEYLYQMDLFMSLEEVYTSDEPAPVTRVPKTTIVQML